SFDTPSRGAFRLRYASPACSDILCPIEVSIEDTARWTDKFETRAMTTMATYMARLGRIGRINKHEWHTRRLRFVGHKLPQLVKAPTVVAGAVRLADFGALANARQVFQGKLARGRLCSLDKLLADRVVDRSHMACLSAGQPFQKPRGFFRAFALERT